MRQALLVPCATKEDLHDWIYLYLGIDFPDAIVSAESNTSPMGAIWMVYDAFRCRRYNLPDKSRYSDLKEMMAYSSRDSFKTLGASCLEVLVMLHMSLSVAHMAAIDRQAKKAQQYAKEAFDKPYLRDFVTVRNETRIEITRYTHRTSGLDITEHAFEKLSENMKMDYDRKWNYIAIVICTMAGANSEHVPFMVVDEVDVIPSHNIAAYGEAKLIPSPWQGVLPITLYTSTRKFSFGLVQQELDDAHSTADKEGTGLQDFHWNIIDVTQACPPTRHLPEEPKVPIYFKTPANKERGQAISEDQWKDLPEERQKLFHKTEGYSGCLKNCKLFFACKGVLATKQTSKSSLLKEIDHTTNLFRKVSPGMANAQLLCNKPSEEGLIYPFLDRAVHMLTAAQMAEKITGDPYPPTLTKMQLLAVMKDRELEFVSGMDHGHTHNFAVATYAKDQSRAFIFDVQSAPGLELDHKIALLNSVFREQLHINPRIYGDTADPSSNKTIRKAGFHVMEWKKLADSVKGGIEVVRSKIYPAIGEPQLFFLAGDPGCELLFRRMSKYHWMIDEAGRSTDIPDEHISKDEGDDECDAIRYGLMNEYRPKGKVQAMKEIPRAGIYVPQAQPTVQNYLQHFIQAAQGLPQDGSEQAPVAQGAKGKTGRFMWDM